MWVMDIHAGRLNISWDVHKEMKNVNFSEWMGQYENSEIIMALLRIKCYYHGQISTAH